MLLAVFEGVAVVVAVEVLDSDWLTEMDTVAVPVCVAVCRVRVSIACASAKLID